MKRLEQARMRNLISLALILGRQRRMASELRTHTTQRSGLAFELDLSMSLSRRRFFFSLTGLTGTAGRGTDPGGRRPPSGRQGYSSCKSRLGLGIMSIWRGRETGM